MSKRRLGRGDLVFGALLLEAGFLGARFAMTGALDLQLMLGMRTNWSMLLSGYLDPVLGLQFIHDLLLAGLLAFRLRDADRPGCWALPTLVIPFAGALVFVVLLFLPGTIGPNRFGPDPRGWKSREHFDEQQKRLKSGNI